MGSLVVAKCQCGFNKSFSLGGGMDNHLTFCAFPCYCYDCKSLIQTTSITMSSSAVAVIVINVALLMTKNFMGLLQK